jgi:hypothetical protein
MVRKNFSHPQKYSERRFPPSRSSSSERRILSTDLGSFSTDLGNFSTSPSERRILPTDLGTSSPRVRFNLKPIHFPTEFERIENFPPPRFRERSPSDPLVSFRLNFFSNFLDLSFECFNVILPYCKN